MFCQGCMLYELITTVRDDWLAASSDAVLLPNVQEQLLVTDAFGLV